MYNFAFCTNTTPPLFLFGQTNPNPPGSLPLHRPHYLLICCVILFNMQYRVFPSFPPAIFYCSTQY